MLVAAAAAGCGSPSKPTPVDPYPNGPRITCPAPAPITSTTGQPIAVTYAAPTVDGGAPPVTTSCTPPSGSIFNIGTTAITCTATDGRQRTDSCSFNVVVVAPPTLRRTRFVAFGDSITFGENGINSTAFGQQLFHPRFQVPRPYPAVLYQNLTARYTAQSFVVANAGLPSEYASGSGTRSRFLSLIGSGSYDVVLFMEGSNDVSDSRNLGSAAITAIQRMMQDAKNAGVVPYLATIPPMDGLKCCPRRGSAAPLVPDFNDGIRSVASSEGIALVDVYAALNVSPGLYLSDDGLHPNDAGYEKIAQTFFDKLMATLEAPTAPATQRASFSFSHAR